MELAFLLVGRFSNILIPCCINSLGQYEVRVQYATGSYELPPASCLLDWRLATSSKCGCEETTLLFCFPDDCSDELLVDDDANR